MALSDPSAWPSLEVLQFVVPAATLDAFFRADKEAYTTFLETKDGFLGKFQTFNTTDSTDVTVRTYVFWESYDLWKSISPSDLEEPNEKFDALYGPDPPIPIPFPADGNGLAMYNKDGLDTCVLTSNIGNTICSQNIQCNCDNTTEEHTYMIVIIVMATIAVILIPMLTIYVLYLHRLLKSERLLGSTQRAPAQQDPPQGSDL